MTRIGKADHAYLNPRRPPPPLRRELLLRPLKLLRELLRLELLLQRVELLRRLLPDLPW